MAGRYGYVHFNEEENRRRRDEASVRPPLSTAAIFRGAQKGNLHRQFNRMVANQDADNAARKVANNAARKAKKGANNALEALKNAQRKAFGVNQNSSAGLTRRGHKKEMTAKKMKKRQKIHQIKKAAIKALEYFSKEEKKQPEKVFLDFKSLYLARILT